MVQASVEDNRTYVVVRGGIKESDGSNLTVSLGALTAIIVTIVIIAMLIVIAVTAIICIGFHSKHSKGYLCRRSRKHETYIFLSHDTDSLCMYIYVIVIHSAPRLFVG